MNQRNLRIIFRDNQIINWLINYCNELMGFHLLISGFNDNRDREISRRC